MPRALKDILTELRELITGDYTVEKLVQDLQSRENGWPELHQDIFNAGHKKATAQHGTDIRSLEQKLEAEQGTVTELRNTVKKLEAKAPDAASLRTEYEQRETNLRRELEGRIGELQTKVTSGYRMTRAQKLAKELANDEHRVYPEYATEVSEGKFADRFTEDDKGQPIVLQLGQKIPYAAANEDEAIKMLAKDIRKNVPSFAIRPSTDRGAGNRNDGPGGGQGGSPASTEDLRRQKVASGDYAF